MLPRASGRRVLIVIWDGFRPDMLSDKYTPTLAELARSGVCFENSHCCFPTDTRVNAAGLATGARPGAHGIVANELYIPQLATGQTVSTAQRDVLEQIAMQSGGALAVPSLSQVIQDHGLTAASACSGSTGTATLSNYARDSIIIHPEFCQPREFEKYIRGRFGRSSGHAPVEQRNQFVVDVFVEHILAEVQPELALLWLTTPDYVQHACGLGTPENLASIRANDAHLRRVLDALEANSLREETDVLVGSDHGFSTSLAGVAVAEALAQADLGPGRERIIVTSSGVFIPEGDPDVAEEVVRCLQSLDGMGAIWTPGGTIEGTLDRRRLYPDHERAPSVVYSVAWEETANEYGVWGSARGSGRARHGTSGRTDIRNLLVASGGSFRRGVQSDVPVSIVDIAPTALWILGIEPLQTMEGRVIEEALQDGPRPDEVPWELENEEAAVEILGKRYMAWAEYARVEGRTYLRQAGAGEG